MQLPLSVSQKELWTELGAWSQSRHLNIGGFTEVAGELEPEVLKQALDHMVKANDALRLRLNDDGSQTLLDFYDHPLTIKNFSAHQEPEFAAKQWQQEWMSVAFDWQHQPAIRFALVTVSKTCHYLVIQCLHTTMDGWSLSTTIRKWGAFYTWLQQGQQGEITQDKTYQEHIDDSLKYISSKSFAKDERFWRDYLPELPEPLFEQRYQYDNPDGVARASIETCDVNRYLLDQIEQLAKRVKATSFHCFLAALAIYLYRAQGKCDFVIGVPTLNRGGGKYKNTLGMFVSVLPIRFQIEPSMSAIDIVQTISRALKQSYRYAKYPLSEQFKRLNVIQKGKERIFDVLFSYEKFEFCCDYGEAKAIRTRQTFPGQSRYPLAISLTEFNDFEDAEMVLEGNQEFFSTAETRLLGKRVLDVASQIYQDQNKPLSQFLICPREEQIQILHATQNQHITGDYAAPYHQLVADKVSLTPEAPALYWQEQCLSYQQLWHLVLHQAKYFLDVGIQVSDCVALALDRGPEVSINMLAVSLVGGQFLILDTETPAERVASILAKAEAKLLLHNKDNCRFQQLKCAKSVVTKLQDNLHCTDELLELELPEVSLDAPAYVLFTSGSTGQPKGVQIPHKALSKRLAWIADHWQIDHNDISLQATQVNFDPALVELLLPLIKGGAVAYAPPGRLLPESLPALIQKFSATLTAFVPSTLARFLDGIDNNRPLTLRVCCCGGETLCPELAGTFIERTGADLYNVYGPTEATIFATAWRVKQGGEHFSQLPLGSQLSDTQLHILDSRLAHMPYGVMGEIYLSGDTLALGYLNDADKTAESFVQTANGTMYKTGDLGWIDTDGVLHFCGRKDRQIKLRGYRIELPEIEHALLKITEIKLAAVKVVELGVKPHLMAWVTQTASLSSSQIHKKLAKYLPDYMLPTKVVCLADMPYTANGKIDYKALPVDFVAEDKPLSRAAIGPLEKQILAIWQKALKRDDIGVNDNFFEYGGDSLAAVIAISEIENHIGKRLSLHQLVENPSIAQLTECIKHELELPKLIVSLGDTTRSTSLYIAASGNGDLLRFEALAKAMHGVCDLHMLQPAGNETDLSIKELAALYAEKIAQREQGEVYIAGFSVGGLAALETAKLLQEKNIGVKELFIVDTILMQLPTWLVKLWDKLCHLVTKCGLVGRTLLTKKAYSVLTDRGLYMQVKGMQSYQASNYDGDTLLIKSSRFRMIQNYLVRGWLKILSGKVKEFTIQTSHSGFFEPGRVDKLAKLLSTRIKDK